MSTIFALVALTLSQAPAPVESMPVHVAEGAHPRAFLTNDEVGALRERAASQDWAEAVAQSVLTQADALVAEPLDIPHAGGQWSHWYSCKKDGGSLQAKSPTEHVCPVCGTVYTGWPYDDVYITFRHHHWYAGVDTLGIAYTLDPKPAYAERARDILMEYASFYASLPLHDRNGKESKSQGRLFAQTLDEAVGLCQFARGYDLVYDAPCFTADDHAQIETGFLRPMVETIQANPMGASNWQSWHNAGVASVGFVLGDTELVDWAVNGPGGFLFQMRESVTPSGMWFEGSPSYHWYALSAHLYLLEAAARAGMDLYALPPVKKMFDAPLRQLFPDLTFPALNDSTRSSITSQRSYYEVAYRRFDDPTYAALLAPRDSAQALLWGVDTVPDDSTMTLRLATSNEPSEGLAILRDPERDTAVFFDYGPGVSGHVHPAKLGLILYAFGDERFVDPGRLRYGNPMHRAWFTQTLAHNTVVVNENSQKKAPCTLEAYAATKVYALARAKCERASPGVVLDRTLCLTGNVILDVFHCTSDQESTFDLPLHMRGTLSDVPEGEPVDALGEHAPYSLLRNVRRFPERLNAATVNIANGQRIALRFLDASACFQAEGYGPDMKERLPLILRRQKGTDVWFIGVYQLLTGDEAVKMVDANVTESGATVSLPTLSLHVGDDTRLAVPGNDGEFTAFVVDPHGAREAEGP